MTDHSAPPPVCECGHAKGDHRTWMGCLARVDKTHYCDCSKYRPAAPVEPPPAPVVEPSVLTFSALRDANVARLPLFKNRKGEPAHSQPDGSDWSLGEWCTAVTGELGEAANLIKKVQRGDMTLDEARADLADELADVQCYLDILAFRAGVDLGETTADKWNRVSERVGVDLRLPTVALRSEPRPQELDNCEFCLGAKGGVRGNENRIGGVVVCDYCTVLHNRSVSEPRPQPTSEELEKALDDLERTAVGERCHKCWDKMALEGCINLNCTMWCESTGITMPPKSAARAEVERLFARSQGFTPTPEDVALVKDVGADWSFFHVELKARELGFSVTRNAHNRLSVLASRMEAGIRHERTYTRDEVLRIATAAATMHKGYPPKGWPAADAALAAVEEYDREGKRSEPATSEQAESERLREQLAGAKRWASRVEDDYRAMRQILTDVFKLGDDAWGLTLEGFREAAELAVAEFARSQGYQPTKEDVELIYKAARENGGAYGRNLAALATRLSAALPKEEGE